MSDADVIKQINESREDQKLRQMINEGQDLSNADPQALERYENLSESGKEQFKSKGWKNG